MTTLGVCVMNCVWYQDENGVLLFCRRRFTPEEDGAVWLELGSRGKCVETFIDQCDETGSALGVWSGRRVWPVPECTGWDWKPEAWVEPFVMSCPICGARGVDREYGCEIMDAAGTIWDHATNVARERDKLRALLLGVLENDDVAEGFNNANLGDLRQQIRDAVSWKVC